MKLGEIESAARLVVYLVPSFQDGSVEYLGYSVDGLRGARGVWWVEHGRGGVVSHTTNSWIDGGRFAI